MGMLLITSSPPAGLVHAGKGGNIILDFWSRAKVSLRSRNNRFSPLCLSILDFHSTSAPGGVSGALFSPPCRAGSDRPSRVMQFTPGKG